MCMLLTFILLVREFVVRFASLVDHIDLVSADKFCRPDVKRVRNWEIVLLPRMNFGILESDC